MDNLIFVIMIGILLVWNVWNTLVTCLVVGRTNTLEHDICKLESKVKYEIEDTVNKNKTDIDRLWTKAGLERWERA